MENVSVAKLLGEQVQKAKISAKEITDLLELAASMTPEQVNNLLAAVRVVTDYAEVLQAIGAGKLPSQSKS